MSAMHQLVPNPDVPDDAVPSIDFGDEEVRFSIYGHDTVQRIIIRMLDSLPLKVGERAEFEVVAIERRMVER